MPYLQNCVIRSRGWTPPLASEWSASHDSHNPTHWVGLGYALGDVNHSLRCNGHHCHYIWSMWPSLLVSSKCLLHHYSVDHNRVPGWSPLQHRHIVNCDASSSTTPFSLHIIFLWEQKGCQHCEVVLVMRFKSLEDCVGINCWEAICIAHTCTCTA